MFIVTLHHKSGEVANFGPFQDEPTAKKWQTWVMSWDKTLLLTYVYQLHPHSIG